MQSIYNKETDTYRGYFPQTSKIFNIFVGFYSFIDMDPTSKVSKQHGNDSCEEGNHTALKMMISIQNYSDGLWVKVVAYNNDLA